MHRLKALLFLARLLLKGTVLCTLTLLLVAALITWQRLPFLQHLVPELLVRQGVEEPQFTLTQLDQEHIHIKQFSGLISLPENGANPSGQKLGVDMAHFRMSYDLDTLLHKRVKGIQIESLILDLRQFIPARSVDKDRAIPEPSLARRYTDLLNMLFTLDLHLQEITINKLIIHSTMLGPLNGLPVRLHYQAGDGEPQLELALHAPTPAPSLASADSQAVPPPVHLLFQIHHKEQPVLTLSAQLAETLKLEAELGRKQIALQVDADFAQIKQILPLLIRQNLPNEQVKQFSSLKGNMNAALMWQIVPDEQNPALARVATPLSLNLQLAGLQVPQVSLNKLDLQAKTALPFSLPDLSKPLTQITLLPESQMQVNDVRIFADHEQKKQLFSAHEFHYDLDGILTRNTQGIFWQPGKTAKVRARKLRANTLYLGRLELRNPLPGVQVLEENTSQTNTKKSRTILLDLKKSLGIRCQYITTGDILLPGRTTIRLAGQANKRVQIPLNQPSASPLTLAISPLNVKYGKKGQETLLSSAPLTINLRSSLAASASKRNRGPGKPDKNLTAIKAVLQTDGLTVQHGAYTIPLRAIDAKTTFDTQKKYITVQGSFLPKTVPGALAFTLSHSLKNGTGTLNLNTLEQYPFLFNQQDGQGPWNLFSGSRLHQKWSKDIRNLQAELKTAIRVAWGGKSPLQAEAHISLDKGQGQFKNIRFQDLKLENHLQLLPTLLSQKPSTVHIGLLDTGIPIENISLKVRLSPSSLGSRPVVQINDIQAHIFEGMITTKDMTIDTNKVAVDTLIRISHINLAEIARLQKFKAIKVSGHIEGILPLQLTQEGVVIERGEVKEEGEGGVIRYTPPLGTAERASQLTAFALKALEEFHYRQLRGEVSYEPDGKLNVNLHLQGISPPLETTRPVHLNINTEQNMLSLLKSLQYSKELTTGLGEHAQQLYTP